MYTLDYCFFDDIYSRFACQRGWEQYNSTRDIKKENFVFDLSRLLFVTRSITEFAKAILHQSFVFRLKASQLPRVCWSDRTGNWKLRKKKVAETPSEKIQIMFLAEVKVSNERKLDARARSSSFLLRKNKGSVLLRYCLEAELK